MFEDGRALKRKRDDDDGGNRGNAATREQPELERGEFFFDDGSVVLIAENTYYKVYQGILSRNSKLFRDMFSLPQPPDAEQIDGCPVVRLQDSPKDVARILTVLFDSRNTYFMRETALPFVVVSTMLRLGSKYQIDHIRDEAVRRLKTCFPEKLEDFRTYSTAIYGAPREPYFLSKDISLTAQHSIAVINPAQTHDVPSLLASAYFTLIQFQYDAWIQEFTDEDGVRWKLSQDDLINCMFGNRNLRMAYLRSVHWMFPPQPSQACRTKETCRGGITTSAIRLREVLSVDTNVLLDPRWIDGLATGENEDPTKPRGFCDLCAAHFKTVYEKERQDAWRNLGKHFRVAPA